MKLDKLSFVEIGAALTMLLDFAQQNPGLRFLLTPVGTGLAGHSKSEVWKVLEQGGVPNNVFFGLD